MPCLILEFGKILDSKAAQQRRTPKRFAYGLRLSESAENEGDGVGMDGEIGAMTLFSLANWGWRA